VKRQRWQRSQLSDELRGSKKYDRKTRRSNREEDATYSATTDQTENQTNRKGKEADRDGGDAYKQQVWVPKENVKLGTTSDSGSGGIEDMERISLEISTDSSSAG